MNEENKPQIHLAHKSFCDKWGVTHPLHSFEIRAKTRNFAWIDKAPSERRIEFMEDLTRLLVDAPLLGIACVIDRPRYQARYLDEYSPPKRWSLCKTAFCIVVERSLRYAKSNGCKLRVYVESAGKKENSFLQDYYNELRTTGSPFGPQSAKYGPLSASDYAGWLKEFRVVDKSSRTMQLADLYLYPMVRAGYEPSYVPYAVLRTHRKLIDDYLASQEIPQLGIKYSCF